MFQRLNLLFKIAETIGIRESDLLGLLERLVEFLILDFSINSTRVSLKIPFSHRPPQPSDVIRWLRSSNLKRDFLPPVPNLAKFLSTYHVFRRTPTSTKYQIEEGCAFPISCAYNDLEIAKRLEVPIEKDHIVPSSKGGISHSWQFQPLCRPHNLLKGNALFWDIGLLPIKGWCQID